MWTPNISTPVVRMLCHHGPVRSLAVDQLGRYLATAGADGQVRAFVPPLLWMCRGCQQQHTYARRVKLILAFRAFSPLFSLTTASSHRVTTGCLQVKVWDVRTYRPLHAYFSHAPATSLDISQRGLLAVGYGRRIQACGVGSMCGEGCSCFWPLCLPAQVPLTPTASRSRRPQVWQDALGSKTQSPYLVHNLAGGALAQLAFCPYEDVLAAGHAGGLSTMLVPGA